MDFSLDSNHNDGCWCGEFDYQNLRCTKEEIRINKTLFSVTNPIESGPRNYTITDGQKEPVVTKITFNYSGSILSQLQDDIPTCFDTFKESVQSIQTFGLLTPHFLKQNTPVSAGSIGMEGENLAAFLFELDDNKRANITEKLKKIYPSFGFYKAECLPDNNKVLYVGDIYLNGNITYQIRARYVSDGLLRLIAFFAQLEPKNPILLFDEIENGINPELIGFLLKEFVNAKQQICVTTHNAVVLNDLEDDEARESVHYFYKTYRGYTRCTPFFEIPSVKEKLGILGPGEVFDDTDLTRLYDEMNARNKSLPQEHGKKVG